MTAFLTLVRAVHFGSCLLLQAVFAVLFLVLMPARKEAGGGASRDWQQVHRRLHRLLVVCLLLALVSGFLWLWLAIAGMNGSGLSEALQSSLFWMVLTQTQPGYVWAARVGIALVFAGALFFFKGAPRGSKSASLASWICAASATLLTASLAWLGHAGAGEGPNQNLQLGGDVLHLVAAGMWPAGLAPLAVFLGSYLKKNRDPDSLAVACLATRKFSAFSLVTVGLLVLSGIVNSYYLVGSFQALVATDYGRLLMLKLALFTAMVGIGAWNLFITRRRLIVPAALPPADADNAALATVARNVWIEIALGTLVLLIVGLLGILPPAIHS